MARTLADVSATVRRRWLAVALVAGVLLLSGAASLASAYHETQHDARRSAHERWDEAAAYTYAVPVVRNSTLWPVGTELPMGMPAYFRTISNAVPFRFSWNASPGSALDEANATATVHVRDLAPDGRVYWEFSRTLADARAPTATAGSNASGIALDGTIDLDALVAQTNAVTQQLPADGGLINWTVETVVTYAVTADGSTDHGTDAFVFPFDVKDPRVTLPLPDQVRWDKPHATSETTLVPREAGLDGALADLPGLALAVVGLALGGFLLHARYGDPLARLPPRDEAYVREHLRHKSWITTSAGELDVGGFPSSVVDVPTLDALVETAADARARVLHDATLRVYYVVLPTTTYRYARHAVTTG